MERSPVGSLELARRASFVGSSLVRRAYGAGSSGRSASPHRPYRASPSSGTAVPRSRVASLPRSLPPPPASRYSGSLRFTAYAPSRGLPRVATLPSPLSGLARGALPPRSPPPGAPPLDPPAVACTGHGVGGYATSQSRQAAPVSIAATPLRFAKCSLMSPASWLHFAALLLTFKLRI